MLPGNYCSCPSSPFPNPNCTRMMAKPLRRTGPLSPINKHLGSRVLALSRRGRRRSFSLISTSDPYGWRPTWATPYPSTYSRCSHVLWRRFPLVSRLSFSKERRSFILLRGGGFPGERRSSPCGYGTVSKNSKPWRCSIPTTTPGPRVGHEGFEPRWALSVDHLLRKLQAHQFPLPPHHWQGLGLFFENGASSFSLRCDRTRTVPAIDGPDAMGFRQSYFQSVRMVDLRPRLSLASLPFFKWDLRAKFI